MSKALENVASRIKAARSGTPVTAREARIAENLAKGRVRQVPRDVWRSQIG